MTVYCRLLDDTLISQQPVYIREFEQFETFGEGVNGLPITNEWRFFVLDSEVVGCGFYWSEHYDFVRATERGAALLESRAGAEQFVRREVVPRVTGKVRFWVVDVGRSGVDEWRVVELNDGQMAGLSCVDPDKLYAHMARCLRESGS